MDRQGMTYLDACKALGIEPGERPRMSPSPARRTERPAWAPRVIEPPPDAWQERARAFVEWAAGNLESDHGKDAMEYLEGRGLAGETITAARLGWNPKAWNLDRETWGLLAETWEDGRSKALWIPAGIVIPVYSPDGSLSGVKIRRPDDHVERDRQKGRKGTRYVAVSGGSGACMVLPGGPAAVVVEAELDALLVHQEAREMVSGVALGSASNRPDTATMEALELAETVLVALDADPAGAKHFWDWWAGQFPQARRLPPIGAKDPTDMHRAGKSIRVWIMAGLTDGPPPAPEPPPVSRAVPEPPPAPALKPEAPESGDCDTCRARGTWEWKYGNLDPRCFYLPAFQGKSAPGYPPCSEARKSCPRTEGG